MEIRKDKSFPFVIDPPEVQEEFLRETVELFRKNGGNRLAAFLEHNEILRKRREESDRKPQKD